MMRHQRLRAGLSKLLGVMHGFAHRASPSCPGMDAFPGAKRLWNQSAGEYPRRLGGEGFPVEDISTRRWTFFAGSVGESAFRNLCGRFVARCRRVLCIDAHSGATVWKREFGSHLFHQHGDNSYASSTPAVDGRHLYVCWNTPQEFTLIALNLDGSDAWKADLGPFVSQHGGGNSPIVVGDVVILGDDNEGKESFLFGFDASSGKMLWKLPRQSDKFSAATPCVFTPASGSPQVIFTSKVHGMTAVDPVAGKMIWQLDDLFNLRTVSSPIAGDGLIFATCGEGGGGHVLVAVKPGDGGVRPRKSLTRSPEHALRSDAAPREGSSVFLVRRRHGHLLSRRYRRGDLATARWRELLQLSGLRRRYDFLHQQEGRSGGDRRFRHLQIARPHAPGIWTPSATARRALANSDMFVRTWSHLVCIAGNIGPQ